MLHRLAARIREQLPDIRRDVHGRLAVAKQRVDKAPRGGKDGADDEHAEREHGQRIVVCRVDVGADFHVGRVFSGEEGFELHFAHEPAVGAGLAEKDGHFVEHVAGEVVIVLVQRVEVRDDLRG
jgi:hypothetical protein